MKDDAKLECTISFILSIIADISNDENSTI